MDRFFSRIQSEVRAIIRQARIISKDSSGYINYQWYIRIPVFKNVIIPETRYNIKHSGNHSNNRKDKIFVREQKITTDFYYDLQETFYDKGFIELCREHLIRELESRYREVGCHKVIGKPSNKQTFSEYIPEYSYHFKIIQSFGKKYYTAPMEYNLNCKSRVVKISVPLIPEGAWYKS